MSQQFAWFLGLLVFLGSTSLFAQTVPTGGVERGKVSAPGTWSAQGKTAAVAAGGQGAVDAGIEILQAGGNAMDASVATILALSVTDSSAFCFGGEVPILVYDAKRNVVEVVCGLGTAPRLATREHFAGLNSIPGSGPQSAAVPGVLDACVTVLDRYGTKTFSEVVAPTLRILDRKQQPWHADLARTLRILVASEKRATERKQGLRFVADTFYRGEIAEAIDAWSRANGGLIRYADLATHATRIEQPVIADYRGMQVYKCGAWTQGPYLLQTLQLLGGFELDKLGQNSPEAVHRQVEALKLALADRDVYYGDPHFSHIPVKALLAPEYAELRRPLIDPERASLVQRPGDPILRKAKLDSFDPRIGTGGPAKDTTTCLVADGAGNVVAATPSGFSGVVAGKTGIYLGTRLQSFNLWEGSPNCIEPGKRPRITLTPTLVLKNGKPVIAVSVAGGDLQDQATLQVLNNLIDFGVAPDIAVTSPRFATNHYLGSFRQKAPELGSLHVNPDFSASTIEALTAKGHIITKRRPSEAPIVIRIDPTTGVKQTAGDPQAGRHARAY